MYVYTYILCMYVYIYIYIYNNAPPQVHDTWKQDVHIAMHVCRRMHVEVHMHASAHGSKEMSWSVFISTKCIHTGIKLFIT
jgi:hypothetical protein